MEMPYIPVSGGIRKTTQVRFKGLDHNQGAKDGSIWDMSNLWAQNYSQLQTRPHRYMLRQLMSPGGLFAWEKLCWVDGDKFFYDGVEKGTVTKGLKTFGSLASKIIIMPDKAFYDVKTDEFGSLESTWAGDSLTFTNGTYNNIPAKANTIEAPGINWADYFKPLDAVTISGCTKHEKNNTQLVIREIEGNKLTFYEHSFELDPEDAPYTETGSLTISRTMPDLLHLCECQGRLWGCDQDTIYASALQDPTNWNRFDQLDSDSWQWRPSSSGYFSGCIAYKNFPIFFKEEKIHKIYGSLPSDFRSIDSATLGLEAASGGSLASAGETLFYLGRTGMMAYGGGIPQVISKAFGGEKYTGGVAGSDGLKYYISCKGTDGKYRIFVFDPDKRAWHKEDYLQITHFANCGGNLYGLGIDGSIWILGDPQELPEGVTEENREGTFPWFVEFTDFTDSDANRKGVTKIQLRMNLEGDGFCKVLFKYDDNDWEVVRCLEGEGKKRNYNVPITPKRCDHYRIRLEGRGDCTIDSLARNLYHGSSRG